MNGLASNLARVAVAALALAFAAETAASAVSELTHHIVPILLFGLLAIGIRIAWQRSSC